MEDDAERVSLARPHHAHAMAKVDAIDALRAANRAVMDGKYYGIATTERDVSRFVDSLQDLAGVGGGDARRFLADGRADPGHCATRRSSRPQVIARR